MDRVELYVKGIDMPPLGSYADHVLRRFMVLDRSRRVNHAKLMVKATAQGNDVKNLEKMLVDYIDSEFRIKDFIQEGDDRMFEEYNAMKRLKLQATMNRKGGYIEVKNVAK